ncbi:MAG: Glyoxalase-like domain protein [Deltaproteobacteria bacterium]|nr:Glyoxalase-like domain protein [Deltaproteobacteria bacterium]
MSVTLTTPCVHIEQAVPDLAAAVRFMERVLGAQKIEQELVRFINDPVHRVLELDHLDCGEAVFQFCMPVPGHDYMPAAQYLKTIGPCVTNLNFYVDDDAHAAALLAAEGADTGSKFAMHLMFWDRLLGGTENCKPSEEMGDGYFMGTRHLWGFDFEFAKEPWKGCTKQRIQYPAFVTPRPPSASRVGRVRRLRVVVEDVQRCCANLTRLISASSRSEVYATHEGTQAKVAHITLRGLELQYCQPLGHKGPLHDYLQRYGQGISAVVFPVMHLETILAAADQQALAAVDGTYVDWREELGEQTPPWSLPRTYRLASRGTLGFDIELAES